MRNGLSAFALLFVVSCNSPATSQSAEKTPESPSPTQIMLVENETPTLEVAANVEYVRDPKTIEKTKPPLCFGVIRSRVRTTHDGYQNKPVSITYIPCADIPSELLIK